MLDDSPYLLRVLRCILTLAAASVDRSCSCCLSVASGVSTSVCSVHLPERESEGDGDLNRAASVEDDAHMCVFGIAACLRKSSMCLRVNVHMWVCRGWREEGVWVLERGRAYRPPPGRKQTTSMLSATLISTRKSGSPARARVCVGPPVRQAAPPPGGRSQAIGQSVASNDRLQSTFARLKGDSDRASALCSALCSG